MDSAWALAERVAHVLGWMLEQLMLLDRILSIAASIYHHIHHDFPDVVI